VTSGARSFSAAVVQWQRRHGRHALPWQGTRDPYRVWLSEIMLQQTQVATVIGYYGRFLERFPDVQALAAASIDEVLALWSGLGYYSRARNLHRCAQVVVEQHGGEFPRGSEALAQLPGIGRSTAAAIAAFCFGERAAILDGNVKRVLTRVLAFGDDLAVGAHERRLWDEATRLLPEEGIEAYTQGLMDLGATVCLARSPHCMLCPVHSQCGAARVGRPQDYPVKSRRLRRGLREHWWLWLRWRDAVWLAQEAYAAATRQWPGSDDALPGFTHVLTHLDWQLHPMRWTLPSGLAQSSVQLVVDALPAGRWFEMAEALSTGLPAPLRKLLESA
jgi:A/G-specific adenine glycosylase